MCFTSEIIFALVACQCILYGSVKYYNQVYALYVQCYLERRIIFGVTCSTMFFGGWCCFASVMRSSQERTSLISFISTSTIVGIGRKLFGKQFPISVGFGVVWPLYFFLEQWHRSKECVLPTRKPVKMSQCEEMFQNQL